MQSPDIWGDIPYGNYTYPYDSLLNSPDSLQHAESMRMLRDLYIVNVETSQGANQFIKFCQQISDNWLPSLFSSESFILKLILLLLLVVGLFYNFVPALKNKITNYITTVRLTTVCLALMLLAVPLGNDYYPTICLTILGVGLLIVFLFIIARLSLKIKEHGFWAALVIATIIMAFLNISEPIPNLLQIERNHNHIDNYFLVVSTAFFLFTVLSFILAWQKFYEFKKTESNSAERKNLRKQKLFLWALFSWCFAYLIYFIGIYYSGTQRSMLTSLLRPAVSASKIFILADNTADVTLAFRRSGLFMGMLSLARLSGFLVSTQVIINLLGARVKASTKIMLAHCHNSTLYVFFGINPASINAAKSITIDTRKDGINPLVVFVDTSEDNTSMSQTTYGFGSFMSLFAHKKEAFDAIGQVNKPNLPALLAISSTKLEDITSDGESLSSIGLRKLERLIEESSKTEFFILSKDENANISGAKKLIDLLKNGDKTKYTIYCNCRNNSLSQLLQFNDYRIETIDFAKLAIDQLKNKPERLLTDLLDFDETGCCCSPFRSVVIGMNDVGEEAVNYLYEYGAFVNKQMSRSDFECHVFDNNMHGLEGNLYMRIPELKYREGKRDQNVRVNLINYKEGSEEFWNWFDHHISSLQFILISLRDEDEQLSLADEIYNLAVRRRAKEPSLPLRIFVCAYTTNSANKLDLMAKTYRNLNNYGNVELISFGMSDELFHYDNITKKTKIDRAKQFYLSYQKATEKLSERELTWDERHEIVLSKNKYDNSKGNLASILELLRMESQDISNEYHRSTKISIIKRALAIKKTYTMQDLYDVLPESLTQNIDADQISNDDYLNSLIKNLAALEHVRWIASHEIQGFQYDAKVDKQIRSLLKKHPYMVDWNDLPNSIKLYDVAVVVTSLMIEKDENEKEKNNIQSTTD